MEILYDRDIKDVLTYQGAIEVMDGLVRSMARQNVNHPPRHYFHTQKGSMTFTIGELLEEKVAGFRLYGSPKTTQLTLTMDTHTGEFKGLIIGKLIGVVRTACLNAVAIRHLARENAQTLGVLGSGFQARHHALAALEVRRFSKLVVYSRDPEKREAFCRFVEERLEGRELKIEMVDAAGAVVEESDVLICATNSGSPILEPGMLNKGIHINNVGPKYKDRSELPLEVYQMADVLTTDSLTQLYDTKGAGLICFDEIIPRDQIKGLENYTTAFNRPSDAITLFCSIGLAGSEVALANWVLERMKA